MARSQRIKAKSGFYHIMLRGNEKKNIFLDDQDRERFIETIKKMKIGERFCLYAFCLMDNHVHLMLSERTEELAKVMKRITVSYVYYFNKKYKRVGHLFQDRYRSEVIEEDNYVMSLVRYIHRNPVKAGIVELPEYYKWSSYNGYLDEEDYISKELEKEMLLELFSNNRLTAKKEFSRYMNEENSDEFLENIEITEAVDEEQAKYVFEQLLIQRGIKVEDVVPDKISEDLVQEFKLITKLSNRKIAGIINISKEQINKMIKKLNSQEPSP